MAEGELFFYAIIGFFVGIWLFYSGFKRLKLKRLIENMPTSPIRSLAMGLAEIYAEVLPYTELLKSKLTNFGEAIPKQTLHSPFSNKECLYFKYTIERYVRSNKRSYWVTVKQGEAGKYLLVKDKTGTVLVNTENAEVDIPLDNEYGSGFLRNPSKHVINFLKSNNLAYESWLGSNLTMRYREYFIAPGDKLYILGTAGKNPFMKLNTAQQNYEGIMIQKDHNPLYYISDKDEKSVVKSMSWRAFGGIIGGSILSVVCLAIILSYIGIL